MSFRLVLEPYIKTPSKFPDTVIYEDKDFVVIKDQFPKALYHWLILPKNLQISRQNPLTVFEQNKALRDKLEVLINRFRLEILQKLETEYGIKESLDFVRAGVHAVPTMTNIHIHLISQDFNSDRLKTKQHYNSFTTRFFVDFDDLPLASNDDRLNHEAMHLLTKKSDIHCIYCDQNFKNKFSQLKSHLLAEFVKRFRKR